MRSKFDLKRQYQYAPGNKKLQKNTPRTQKARGLFELTRSLPYGDVFIDYKKPTNAILLPHELPTGLKFPMFARPCPVTPKHGFVESRKVYDISEVLGVLMETAAADPNGEVILMPVYTGLYSAVATDAGVTWGRGNDGVTGGKGEQKFIPTGSNTNAFTVRLNSDYPDAGIKDAAYLELVEHNGNTAIVQLRDGPAVVGGSGDWIPVSGVTVQRVIVGNPDIDLVRMWPDMLLAAQWDTDGNERVGSVVWLPGMSLSSHLAVQAILMGLPVMTTREPIVGEKLAPAADQVAPLDAFDLAAIANQIGQYDRFLARPTAKFNMEKYRIHRDDVKTAIATLHSMSFWDNRPHLLRLRAFSIITMARFLAAGVIGEARHFSNNGPGQRGAVSSINWTELMGNSNYVSSETDRNLVFDKAFNMPLADLIKPVEGAVADFSLSWYTKEWTDDRRGNNTRFRKRAGIGGKKWRESAEITRDLIRGILAFQQSPTEENWTAVVTAFNQGVNAAHNNGRVLDKFIDGQAINAVAMVPQFGFINQTAAEVVFGEMSEARRYLITSGTFKLWQAEWEFRSWTNVSLPKTVITPPGLAAQSPVEFVKALYFEKIVIPHDAKIPPAFHRTADIMGWVLVPGKAPKDKAEDVPPRKRWEFDEIAGFVPILEEEESE